MAYLALVRHGESEYNEKGIWTGWDDPDLTEEGIREAKADGKLLLDIKFDFGYVSALKRTSQTLSEIEKVLHREDLPVISAPELNERDYGDYTGKNKWEIEKQIGEAEFLKLRRGWDQPIPNGESLKDVYDREIPYYLKEIEPKLKSGKNVIVASSGNSLRAIEKYLENISDESITTREIAFGEIDLYEIDNNGKVISKQIRQPTKL